MRFAGRSHDSSLPVKSFPARLTASATIGGAVRAIVKRVDFNVILRQQTLNLPVNGHKSCSSNKPLRDAGLVGNDNQFKAGLLHTEALDRHPAINRTCRGSTL